MLSRILRTIFSSCFFCQARLRKSGPPLSLSADRPNKSRFPRAPPAAGSAQLPIRQTLCQLERPVRPFCGIRLADHRPKLLGWDEILQAFATAAIGRSVRPVHQGERTSVPLLRRSVAPAKAGRGTRGSPGSHPVDGWRRGLTPRKWQLGLPPVVEARNRVSNDHAIRIHENLTDHESKDRRD